MGGDGIAALAYDSGDQTLWFSTYDPSGTLYHYDRSGNQLGQLNVTGTYGGYILGAEFDQTSVRPEPASLMLLATGLVGIGGVVVRRRRC